MKIEAKYVRVGDRVNVRIVSEPRKVWRTVESSSASTSTRRNYAVHLTYSDTPPGGYMPRRWFDALDMIRVDGMTEDELTMRMLAS